VNLNGLWKNPDDGLLVQLYGDVNFCATPVQFGEYSPPNYTDMANFEGSMKVIKGWPTSLGMGNLVAVLPKRDVDIVVVEYNMTIDKGSQELSIWKIKAVVTPKRRSPGQQAVVDALESLDTENDKVP